ncbi:Uncharacterized protein K02A2.6 [Stylophora pistillata]|uniref:Uncharacterized protein K02A2.6 n=1 Tax=Stylophora pistillata TaxID=50429 RepID=A0A2B4SZD9_STYPI|nr:Uncharacterized protein K02A2.6 [Stylophora pistillata]
MKKSLLSAPKRLQRMLLRLQKFDLDISYRKGTEMHIADPLSRAYLPLGTQDIEDTQEVWSIAATRSPTEVETEYVDIKSATEVDTELQTLTPIITQGWPERRTEVPSQLQVYFPFRDELSIEDGIYKQIPEFISRCSICNSYKPQQQKEPLKCHEIPARPWQSISADLFEFKGTQYLITTDRYSNFFELDILTSTTARSVFDKLKPHLARYGLPDRLTTDNGPQFDCAEFEKFAAEYQFEHVKMSPRYPQSNGKAENSVKTAKNILRKAADASHDPHLSLLDFRNTPPEGMESNPAQRLFARRTRTLLPTARHLLQPKVIPHVHRNLQLRQNKESFFFNRGAKDLQPLRNGDVVRVRPLPGHSRWFKAQVSCQEAPRSYQVRTEDGRVYGRNRSHLYKVPENFQAIPDEDIVESKANAQTLPSTKKPTEETLQAPHEPSALQLPDVAQPDLQPASPESGKKKRVERGETVKGFHNPWHQTRGILLRWSETVVRVDPW